MNEKFDSNKELLRALLWAYLWLPILNVVVQTGYFIVMLGITENQGNMIAQIYNMTLPATGVVVSQIFNWQLGKLFVRSLIGRYVSIVLITLPAPVIRFALLRKPIKTASIAFVTSIVSFGLGALLHSLLFAPLLDPNAGPGDLLVQIPEYATMLFAFFATCTLLRCNSSSSKGRWIREDESPQRGGRESTGVVPQRVAPPLRLSLDDENFSGSSGYGGFSKPGGEEPMGSIISGSAHFGTPKDPAQQGAQGFASAAVQQPTVIAAPDLQPVFAQMAGQQETPPRAIPSAPPHVQPTEPQATTPAAMAMPPAVEKVAAPLPVSPPVTPLLASQEPQVKPPASREIPGQQVQAFPDFPSMPQEQRAMPRPGALDRLNFPEEAVSSPAASGSVEETPLPAPISVQTDEAKSLPGDLASLLEEATPPEPQETRIENAQESQPPVQESSSSGAKSLPDDLAALLKEIQVTDLPEEEAEPQASPAQASGEVSSEEKSVPDDLAALLKEIQVAEQPEAGGGTAPLTSETLPSGDEDESMPDDLAALLREIQVDELPDGDEGIGGGASMPTLEQLLSDTNAPPAQPVAADSPPDETPDTADRETEVARQPKENDEKDLDPKNHCLLCNEDTADSKCITLPNGWKIHQKCYDEALEKLSAMKTDEETKAFFESSPNLMKVLFMTNTTAPKRAPAETGKTRRKTGEDKEETPATTAEKKKRAPRKTTKKTNTEN